MRSKEFLEKITPFFIAHGYRGFTINQISREFNMSKTTIYELFSNKKGMIKAVMDYQIEKYKDIAEEAKKEKNFFANIETLREKVCLLEETQQQNKNFLELERYYRGLYDYHYDQMTNFIYDVVMDLLRRGVEEGSVRRDLDFRTISHIFSKNYQHMVVKKYTETNNIESVTTHYIELFLQGILTERGFEYLHVINSQEKIKNG